MAFLSQMFSDDPGVILVLADVIKVLFAMAFGACLGSLTNVLVYRIPLGLDVVSPPSRCPSCQTLLTWRENIPVFGWLMLRGRCRFCRSPISPEYPLVEAYVAALFGAAFVLTYSDFNTPWHSALAPFRPDWGSAGFMATWPVFVVVLVLFGSLVAMFLTDAKTFQIPMVLTWVPAIAGLVGHTGFALWLEFFGEKRRLAGLPGTRLEHVWSIATPGHHSWWWIGAAIGGGLGVVVANLLLKYGVFTRSFGDYESWEKQARAEAEAKKATAVPDATTSPVEGGQDPAIPTDGTKPDEPSKPAIEPAPETPAEEAPGQRWLLLGILSAAVAAGVVAWGLWKGEWIMPSVVGLAAVLHVAILSAVGHTATGAGEDQAYWLQYPHARREMLRELIFLSPIAGLAMVGGWAAHRLGGPWEFSQAAMQLVPAQTPPAWLMVLAGVLLGYLVGGGIVWMVRILGSLAFNKEAMGLGDVHLLAAVGACLGWIDAVGAFFAAVVVGAVWGVLGSVLGGSFRRMLPFGPFLVLGTLMVWFAKQGLIEWAVNAIAKPAVRIHLP